MKSKESTCRKKAFLFPTSWRYCNSIQIN